MRNQLFINGRWQDAVSGQYCEVINPANGELIQQIAAANAEDVQQAVTAARAAFDQGGWPNVSGTERAGFLRAIAQAIREQQVTLARMEVLDNGKPLPEAQGDIADAAACFDYYATLAEQLDTTGAKSIALSDERFSCKVVREPVGVVAAITPWNYPLLMAAWKVAPALAAGCTVVLKPSELTSLTALELAAIAQAVGLPAGVLNVITGYGADAGQALIEHPQVDKLAFTGSVSTGSKVMSAAARDIKNVSLELGGKSPFIVFEDSDIEQAVEWIMFGIFWNQGQVCSATSRVLIHEKIYSAVLDRLTTATQNIKMGEGLTPGVLLGPLVSQAQYHKVLAMIETARQQGAQVIGGNRPAHLSQGFFLEPTILSNVALDSQAWCEEIFGPVLCVRSFAHEEQAIQQANDSRFGLAAAVMSQDEARCERVATQLRAGIVWINCSQPTFVEAPWGGYKQSGIGRELGPWGLEQYLETKQITRYHSEQAWGWYLS